MESTFIVLLILNMVVAAFQFHLYQKENRFFNLAAGILACTAIVCCLLRLFPGVK